MFPPLIAHCILILVVALSILLMLLRPRGIAEAWGVCGGAALLVALRLVSLRAAGAAVMEGADVYLFLTGMMSCRSSRATSASSTGWPSSPSFDRFLKVGIIAMPIALIAALGATVLISAL